MNPAAIEGILNVVALLLQDESKEVRQQWVDYLSYMLGLAYVPQDEDDMAWDAADYWEQGAEW